MKERTPQQQVHQDRKDLKTASSNYPLGNTITENMNQIDNMLDYPKPPQSKQSQARPTLPATTSAYVNPQISLSTEKGHEENQ